MLAAVCFLIIVDFLGIITASPTPQETQCYRKDYDYYPYFGTRTAYDLVHGHVTSLDSSCTPVQIWMLARHGTRYPGAKHFPVMQNMTAFRNQILRNHEQGAGQLCSSELDKLRDWQLDSNVRVENAEVLTEQGEKDLRQLAERLRETFRDLLDPRMARPGDFVFRSTNTSRTEDSMKAFARGLFNNDERLFRRERPPVNDTFLAAEDLCPAWLNGYEFDKVDYQRDTFTDGPEMKAVQWNVAQRLGFSQPFDFAKLKTIFDMCRYETAWYPHRTSIWCMLFRGDELKVLEYREDLDFYYFAGPGRPMSSMIGCHLVGDMLEHFKALTTGNFTNQPKGVFYFGHTVTLQNLMAALQIAVEPNPPKANNYHEMHNRDYRTSLLGPFATNVVAVFYRCSGSRSPYKVTIYTAEKLQKLSGCAEGVCDWNFLEQKYGPQVEKCSLDFCFKENAPGSATTLTYSTFIVLIVLALNLLTLA